MPLLEDIADLLSTGGFALTPSLGLMPEQPDVATAIYETGGLGPVHAMSPVASRVVERPRVQIVCRAGQWDYAVARANADSAFQLLDGMATRSINGVEYKWIAAVQDPFLMGRDEDGRVLIACNYDVIRK